MPGSRATETLAHRTIASSPAWKVKAFMLRDEQLRREKTTYQEFQGVQIGLRDSRMAVLLLLLMALQGVT